MPGLPGCDRLGVDELSSILPDPRQKPGQSPLGFGLRWAVLQTEASKAEARRVLTHASHTETRFSDRA